MNFLKGLNWAEWLCLGIAIVACIIMYFLYNDNKSLSREIGGSEEVVNQMSESSQLQIDSAKITDTVVVEFINQKNETQATLDQARVGAINEYIDHAASVKEPDPVRAPKANPTTNVPTTKPVNTDPSVRIANLANRMREHYCAATSNGTNCPTVSSN